MNIRTRIAAGASAATIVSFFGAAATPANAASLASQRDQHQLTAVAAVKSGVTMLPVTGTLGAHTFTGEMSDLSAAMVNGTATLSGSLTGTGLPAAGTKFSTAIDSITAVDPAGAPTTTPPALAPPADPRAPACTVLALDVSGLHLNLLGLVILVPQLSLILGGTPGPGAVLGNALCMLGAGTPAPAPPAPAAVTLLNRFLTGVGH